MLVILDSIINRITQNRKKGKQTFIFIDEIYLLFAHEYSAQFLFKLWKRVRKYGAYCTGITQNVEDLLQSHTARTMLSNSEFIVMLNQAASDKYELAKLLNISDEQMNHIQNVEAGHGLIKVGSSLVPFENKFPRNTKLYGLMSTRPGEGLDQLKAEAETASGTDSNDGKKGPENTGIKREEAVAVAKNTTTNMEKLSDGSEPTERLNNDSKPIVQRAAADNMKSPEEIRAERERLILQKIKEVARSKEEYDALVKKYLGE